MLFCQFKYLGHLIQNLLIILPTVGLQAAGAVLNAIVGICKTAAAPVTQSIQWAIAEQTAEILRIRPPVAGEVFALRILNIIIMAHFHVFITPVLHFTAYMLLLPYMEVRL